VLKEAWRQCSRRSRWVANAATCGVIGALSGQDRRLRR
jgi:hypothetical protein